MLMKAVESYLAVRRAAGFKLEVVEVLLRSFVRYAENLSEQFVHADSAIDWARRSKSPEQKARRLQVVIRLARYLQAEDGRHEIPPEQDFGQRRRRPTPFIFEPADIVRLIHQAQHLPSKDSLLPGTLSTLFALLASTGLRISEALALRFEDITAEALVIRETKFRKSRLVPLHDTAVAGLEHYLKFRRRFAGSDEHLFVSPHGDALRYQYVRKTFRRLVQDTGLEPRPGQPRPQLHSFRHTFAVRALESCPDGRDRIAQNMLALSTYLGHASVAETYWYLQATPQLMKDVAHLAESFVKGERK
jgi:integrase/recombinase XerD